MVAAITEISLPTFTGPAEFADILFNDGLTAEQFVLLGDVFARGDLPLLAILMVSRQHGLPIDDPHARDLMREFIIRNAVRIQELLAQARSAPIGVVRFDLDARRIFQAILPKPESMRVAEAGELAGSVAGATEAMDNDRKSLRARYARPAVVAYNVDGRRLAIATSRVALETKLARMITLEGDTRNWTILVADIHGTAVWRRFDFGDHSSRYMDRVAKIRTEADRLSAKGFVVFRFNLWWKKAVQRIQDSQNILALNVLRVALVQYNGGRISYSTLVKVIKTLDVVIKQDPAADIWSLFVEDSFRYGDKIPDTYFPEKIVAWKSGSLPEGVRVFVIEQVPLTTP
ncbi:MAG: hypothetical protein A3H42_05095 [Deltaproteobacteria bacterium RIFCSPLOWO2_02_FULL_46_8]|nr:MAG: hypothetical protein A3H42_05095 [Deltaproteobacteria bacterium RIFCSPLOWO2_02_FULL_46_8]